VLPARSFLIDGEAIATNGDGLAVFDLIRLRLRYSIDERRRSSPSSSNRSKAQSIAALIAGTSPALAQNAPPRDGYPPPPAGAFRAPGVICTRTGLFASLPTCAAHAPLRLSALLVAARPILLVSLWPGTLGVLVPTRQLSSRKLWNWRLGQISTFASVLSVLNAASRLPGLSKYQTPALS